MAPAPHFPEAVPARPASHVVFVPVDGRVVFWTCCLLIVFCLVWVGLLLHKGAEYDRDG